VVADNKSTTVQLPFRTVAVAKTAVVVKEFLLPHELAYPTVAAVTPAATPAAQAVAIRDAVKLVTQHLQCPVAAATRALSRLVTLHQ